jgi:DNA-directed RNA polymerase subunit N (RpoN/RPB10)
MENAEAVAMTSDVRCLECGAVLADGRGEFIGHLAAEHPETRSGRLAADLLNAMARGAVS